MILYLPESLVNERDEANRLADEAHSKALHAESLAKLQTKVSDIVAKYV